MKRMFYSQLELLGLAYRGTKCGATTIDTTEGDRSREMPSGYSRIREAITALLTAETDFEYSARNLGRNRSRVLAHISKALAELRQAREITFGDDSYRIVLEGVQREFQH